MKRDAFSNCHPAVIFLFFLGAIAIGVVVTHPAYLIAGCVGAALYYLLLVGNAGIRNIAALLPFFSLITFINPFINTRGRHILFSVFGRNYTLEALCYGAASDSGSVQKGETDCKCQSINRKIPQRVRLHQRENQEWNRNFICSDGSCSGGKYHNRRFYEIQRIWNRKTDEFQYLSYDCP